MSPTLAEGVRGCHPGKFLRFLMPNPEFYGQFGSENKLIEGQINEYDMICRNDSVLAFHLWPMIFAAAPFRLQNICRNTIPPRSRTTTPLHTPNRTSISLAFLSIYFSVDTHKVCYICNEQWAAFSCFAFDAA